MKKNIASVASLSRRSFVSLRDSSLTTPTAIVEQAVRGFPVDQQSFVGKTLAKAALIAVKKAKGDTQKALKLVATADHSIRDVMAGDGVINPGRESKQARELAKKNEIARHLLVAAASVQEIWK